MAYYEGTINDLGCNNNGNNGWNDWSWIIGLALVGGLFGNGGFGFGGNSGYSEVQRGFDQNAVINKLDGLTYGLSDSTYALTNAINGGFNSVQASLCQGFNGISREIADCCCQTQRAIDGVNYNMAMNTYSIQQTLCSNTRDLIENQNANYRALHDEIVANRMEDKNAQIAAQQNEINALRLAASQAKQNSYLVNELRPCPVPAYITCNPYQSYNACGCGC